MTGRRQTLICTVSDNNSHKQRPRRRSGIHACTPRPSRTLQNGLRSNSSQGRLENWPGNQAFRQMGDPGVCIPTLAAELDADDGFSVEVKDISLTDYIQVRHAVYLPHTAGRYAKKQFKKAQMPIVERLVDRYAIFAS